MIVCPSCQHKNPEGVGRCEACGQSLDRFVYRACPSCGALNPSQNLFCSRCLTELTLSDRPETPVETPVKPFEPLSLPPQPRQADRQAEPSSDYLAPPAPSQSESAPPAISEPRVETPIIQARSEIPSGKDSDSEIIVEAEPVDSPALIEDIVASQEDQVFILRDYEIAQAGQVEGPQDLQHHADASASEDTPPSRAWVGGEDETDDESLFIPPDVEESAPITSPALPVTAASPLESLAEVLPIEASVVVPHRAKPPARPLLTETEQFDAALFQQIAAEGAPLNEPIHTLASRQVKPMPRVGQVLVYCLVLAAALAPFFTGGRTNRWVQPRDSVLGLARTIERLPPGATVLISFDYGPTYAGEMDLLALTIIRHLAHRSVRMLIMSTQPAGIGIAERVMRIVEQETPTLKYGEQYVILGYLPGQEAGLRTLNQSISSAFKVDHVQQRALEDLMAAQGVIHVRDLDQIVLIADESSTVQQWIEQIHTPNKITIQALVTSRIEPLLIPYQQAMQLNNMVSGAMGAIEYQCALGEQITTNQTDSYVALFLLVLLIALISNVAYVRSRKNGR